MFNAHEFSSEAEALHGVFERMRRAKNPPPGPGHNKSPFTEDPLPLYRKIPKGSPFPVEALGQTLGGMAKALHEAAVQSPMAICGTSVLAAAACSTQALRDVELPIGMGKVSPISLYLMAIALSGERKTATDSQALHPVSSRTAELRKDYEVDKLKYQNALDIWTDSRQRIIKHKKMTAAEKRSELDDLGKAPSAPKTPILTLEEPTIEGLTKHLKAGYPSVGLFSSEGGQFIGGHSMSDEAKGRSSASLNKFWDIGILERVRSSEDIAILPGRRLSIFLQAQPDVAQTFLSDPVLQDIGLHARFLITHPDSARGHRLFKELSSDHQIAIANYGAQMLKLLRRDLPYDERGDGLEPPILPMATITRERWIAFSNHIELLLLPGEELQEISGFANKLAEHAARIAAVLQVFDDPDAEEMGPEYLARGIKLAEFYADEMLRLHSASRVGAELKEAERLRLWLIDRWSEPYVTVRAIQRGGPGSLREKARIERLLSVLEAHHWVAPVSDVAVDGKPVRTAWAIWGKPS